MLWPAPKVERGLAQILKVLRSKLARADSYVKPVRAMGALLGSGRRVWLRSAKSGQF